MNMKKITLTKGYYALVDDEDFEYLNQWKWYCNNGGYAVREVGGTSQLMHRLLVVVQRNQQVDHVNHDRLDNRRVNLRICNQQQNSANMLPRKPNKLKGAFWDKSRSLWMSLIVVDGKPVFLGRYKTEAEAGGAYLTAATEFWGDFAHA